jgi:hypothetical protein
VAFGCVVVGLMLGVALTGLAPIWSSLSRAQRRRRRRCDARSAELVALGLPTAKAIQMAEAELEREAREQLANLATIEYNLASHERNRP